MNTGRDNFHSSYIHFSKKNQIKPNFKIKTRNRFVLEFFADKITVWEWKPFIDALENDKTLKKISIKLEKTYNTGNKFNFSKKFQKI